jgi:hypothetical protein
MGFEVGWLVGVVPAAAALLAMLGSRPPGRWARAAALTLSVLPLLLLFLLNPAFRIFSRHGLLHAAILYRIVELGIPPDNPLLAGQPLGYHWGYEMVGAAVSAVLSLPPSWSFALINLIALTLTLLLLARASGGLFEHRERALLAPLVAIFAITPIPLWWLKDAAQVGELVGPIMARATPVFQKFANTNGVPLGLVCFAVSLVVLRAPAGSAPRITGLVGALAACGLLYPPLLPAQLVTVATFSVVEGLVDRTRPLRAIGPDAVASVGGLGIAAAGVALLGMRPRAAVRLFDAGFLAADLVSVLLTAAPVAILIAVMWRPLRARAERRLTIQLLAAAVANAGCFLVVALADRNQYKFLIVSQILLGLVGGAALTSVRRRAGTVLAGAVAVLFLGSFAEFYDNCFAAHRDAITIPVEEGRQLRHPDAEQADLYDWMSTHTPPDAVLVDSEHTVTVLGRRAVLAPSRAATGVGFADAERGFVHRTDLAPVRLLGADRAVLAPRLKLVHGLLDGVPGDRDRWLELAGRLGVDELYVVCRTPAQHRRLDALGAEPVHVSPSGNLVLMRWAPSSEGTLP